MRANFAGMARSHKKLFFTPGIQTAPLTFKPAICASP